MINRTIAESSKSTPNIDAMIIITMGLTVTIFGIVITVLHMILGAKKFNKFIF
jgi:hypothetical protein